MNIIALRDAALHGQAVALDLISSPDTFTQLGLALCAILLAWVLSTRVIAYVSAPVMVPEEQLIRTTRRWLARMQPALYPMFASLLLILGGAFSEAVLGQGWLLRGALLLSILFLADRLIRLFVAGPIAARALRWLLLPVLTLHLLGLLDPVTASLAAMSIEIGNLKLTASGVLRVLVFGSLLFWLGWLSNDAGQSVIRRQARLDIRTREVIAKLFQIVLFLLVSLLLLQVMGINLTTLAVFGGALGVGLGFGLQSIASNFISGIILLFDRSLSVGDYVELEDGQVGYVRELNMRHTTLEAFDGKDVLVPNEKFITSPFTNWTHKNRKQRYRVDFSVAYDTDVRALCELIRATVAAHPQVLSGEQLPLEERPDCEIDSFGDSGINMFVEFWMDGIDDGRNRVGGDLLLEILEALQQHGIQIPFPQREVRMLSPQPPAP